MVDQSGPDHESPVASAIPDDSRPRVSAAWSVPIVVAVVVLMVFWRGWSESGVPVEVDFDAAHGLQIGDPVRCRGVSVGEVRDIVLRLDETNAESSIRVELILDSSFADALREDTRFWIERPQFDLRGVDGLETIAGGRFVGVQPGVGPASTGVFSGNETAPAAFPRNAADLVVVVESAQRAGLRLGGPVTYRGVRIGEIERVGLGDAANQVEARLLIDRRYRDLVRERSRFFSTSGVGLELGLDGIRADIGSLEEIVVGGVGLATPPNAGAIAESGDRYVLAPRVEEEWLEWEPSIAWGYDNPPTIDMAPIAIRYQEGLLRRPAARRGWVVRLGTDEFAVPADLLQVPNDAREARIYLGDASASPTDIVHRPIPDRGGLWSRFQLLDSIGGMEVVGVGRWSEPWLPYPVTRVRPQETLLVVSGRSVGNVPVPGHRWRRTASGIELTDVAGLYTTDHGAPVVSAESGALVGLLDRRGGGWGVVEVDPPRASDPVRNSSSESRR